MKVTNTKCLCRKCGKYFNSVFAFDAHRTFENPKVHDWTTRKCDTSAMFVNKAGYWVTQLYTENDPHHAT